MNGRWENTSKLGQCLSFVIHLSVRTVYCFSKEVNLSLYARKCLCTNCPPTTPILSSPRWDLLQNSPVREYTRPAQSLYCTLTITAIYTAPNESHEPAWLQGGVEHRGTGGETKKLGKKKSETASDNASGSEVCRKLHCALFLNHSPRDDTTV